MAQTESEASPKGAEPSETPGADSGAEDWGSADSEIDTLISAPAYLGDRHFYRVVVWALAAVVMVVVIGSLLLAFDNQDIPESIVALGATSIGALAGVVAGNSR